MVLRHINEDFRLFKQFLHVLGAFCDTRKKITKHKEKVPCCGSHINW